MTINTEYLLFRILAGVAQSRAPWCHCVPPSQYLEGWSDTSPLFSWTSNAASTCHSDIDPASHNILLRLKKNLIQISLAGALSFTIYLFNKTTRQMMVRKKTYNDVTLVYSPINVFRMAVCNHLWKYDLICCGSIMCLCFIDYGYLAFSIYCILF